MRYYIYVDDNAIPLKGIGKIAGEISPKYSLCGPHSGDGAVTGDQSSTEAIRSYAEFQAMAEPDDYIILVTDYEMPIMNGLERFSYR